LSAIGCVSSGDSRAFAADRVVFAPDRGFFADCGGVHAHDGYEPADDGRVSPTVVHESAVVRGELAADARKERASMDAMPERVRLDAERGRLFKYVGCE
jgi:hypothetical protein